MEVTWNLKMIAGCDPYGYGNNTMEFYKVHFRNAACDMEYYMIIDYVADHREYFNIDEYADALEYYNDRCGAEKEWRYA